jgi:methylmalonyl-CoA mutase C-terminal domain/subunit
MTLFPAIKKLLDQNNAGDIVLFGGGIIPDEDIKALEKQGIAKLFTPGATTEETIEFVRANIGKRGGKEDIM